MSTIGKGYVQIYTGDGKGKTTASLGLALRAAGRGLRTCVVQFMKGQVYGELDGVKLLGGLVSIEQLGHPQFCKMTDPPDPADIKRAKTALARLHEHITAASCDILIADEAVTAVMFGLIREADLIDLIAKKPDGMELVLTGRGAGSRLIEAADLVTQMQEIKHYYTKGIQARKGIES
jgi:cob(I)alamin adenosyltransferase